MGCFLWLVLHRARPFSFDTGLINGRFASRVASRVGYQQMDLQRNSKGDLFVPYNGPAHPAMNELAAFFKKEGLFTYLRWSTFSCIPPLNITEEQLDEGFDIIDRGLAITDKAFEG